ncbi:MAG: 1-deoxy-D-xylulose-5-phosphate reductoisomerase, partial [Defluviitaleaceae bacterium]|nr:1-deoxy-D-xylulose-5-phosphate reductoisomerase [Defluviitaleaceae bacterium]
MKTIAILGSTGSIGVQTLEVVDSLGGEQQVAALTAHSNADTLFGQILKYRPRLAVVTDPQAFETLRAKLRVSSCADVQILCGAEGLQEAATLGDVCVNALVGSVGLLPTLAAIDAGKDVALANKESIVTAGEIVMNRAHSRGVRIIPIDSEHSAVFQCLAGNAGNKVRRIILTASG